MPITLPGRSTLLTVAACGVSFAAGAVLMSTAHDGKRSMPEPAAVGAAAAAAPTSPSTSRPASVAERWAAARMVPGDDEAAQLREQVAKLEGQLGLQEWAAARQQAEKEGVKMEWPAAMPQKFARTELERNLREALSSCGIKADPVAFECDEPPCIAGMRTDDELMEIGSCRSWSEKYGHTVSLAEMDVDCADGRKERVAFLSPHWDGFDGDDETKDNFYKRLNVRWAGLKGDWKCKPAR